MKDCLFCKIIDQEIPSDTVYQDDLVTVFKDINPAAPVHLLIVPNQHISSVNDVSEDDRVVLGHLFTTARKVASSVGIQETGFRLIVNTGPDAHQEVFHIHMHLLGGGKMEHPMG